MARWLLAAFLLIAAHFAVLVADQPPPSDPGQPGIQKKSDQDDPQAKDVKDEFLREDEALLQKLRIGTDPKSLLKYFQDRTYKAADPKRIEELIHLLASVDFPERETAYIELEKLGSSALFTLKRFKDHPDPEARSRINQLLRRLNAEADPRVQQAVARLIGHYRPPGAEKVLLAYLPFAADESVVQEITSALTEIAAKDPQTHQVLAAQLASKQPVSRRVVAEALVRSGAKKYIDQVRKLLQDPKSDVRLHVALALAQKRDASAVPVLIDLLKELPPEKLWPAEIILVRLAGDAAPQVSLGATENERRKTWEAWKAWWAKQDPQEVQAQLKNLDLQGSQGFIDLVYYSPARVVNGVVQNAGREIIELPPSKDFKKPRWRFVLENTNPVDVVVIGPNRILVAEYTGRRISLRDFDGRILKTVYVGNTYPSAVERLPNGNTFVVTRNRIIEYDRNWKEAWSYQANGRIIYRANKLPDGVVVFIDNSNRLTYLNPATKAIIRTVNVGYTGGYYGGLAVLPNGNILLPQYNNNRVSEIDRNGRVVWSAAVTRPSTADRLPNGDTLVGSMNSRQLVQINRQGRVIWSHTLPGQIYRIRVR